MGLPRPTIDRSKKRTKSLTWRRRCRTLCLSREPLESLSAARRCCSTRRAKRRPAAACEPGARGARKRVGTGRCSSQRQSMAAHCWARDGAGPRGAGGAFGTGRESAIVVLEQRHAPDVGS